MLNTIIISLLKILDNFLTTSKTILVQKNKAIAASILIVVSQFLFYFVISEVVSENNNFVIIAVSIASGIGSFFAFKINDRFSKDKLYLNIITSKNIDELKELCEFLKTNRIKYIVNDSYNRNWTKTISVQVFAATRDESKMLDQYLERMECKYFREILY